MPTCCVCNERAARRGHGERFPTCNACNVAISTDRKHTAADLERMEAEARLALMRRVLRLRRLHAARFGVESLTRIPPAGHHAKPNRRGLAAAP